MITDGDIAQIEGKSDSEMCGVSDENDNAISWSNNAHPGLSQADMQFPARCIGLTGHYI